MATQPSVHEAKEALDHVNEEERKANADRVLETAEKNKVKPAKLDRSRVKDYQVISRSNLICPMCRISV